MEYAHGGGVLSFEKWERFVNETLEKMQEKQKAGSRKGTATGSETGGAENDRAGTAGKARI